ncbi:hypothetical protein CHS0354_014159 [Potamilus streckersoni]|uniref:VWFA domain-containing protein n=1 Tax=Potamilus streckersoni TaxID=2493646 RepID=A0AAE0VYK1_9BIVA|nr:hypothetical protein CHS0354_014159 [Potamilus streckersoni]
MHYLQRLVVLVCITLTVTKLSNTSVKLVSNGYEGIYIYIDEFVEENATLISRLQEIFSEASETMFMVTERRAYLRKITIVLPKKWTSKGKYRLIPKMASEEFIYVTNCEEVSKPNVIGLQECGKPAKFMQLPSCLVFQAGDTPKFGAWDHIIVHEWGHLHWGVYDEYPTNPTDKFYQMNGKWEPTRCSRQLRGTSLITKEPYKDQLCDSANIKSYNLNPVTDCRFIPDREDNVIASLMGSQYISSLISFCKRDTSKEAVDLRHNSEAVNDQNRRCDQRSVWEVLLNHTDFKNENPPVVQGRKVSTKPEFTIVQQGPKILVLVLDVSGSMSGTRSFRQSQAAKYVINNLLPMDSLFGMVSFSSGANILARMTRITDNSVRQSLIEKLPIESGGKTSIGAGLKLAIDLLTSMQNETDGSEIILISDGEENNAPFASNFLQQIMENWIIVNTIAVSQEADILLSNLSTISNGKHFTWLETGYISFADVLSQTITTGGIMSSADSPVIIYSDGKRLEQGRSMSGSFIIDSALGLETVFTVLSDNKSTINAEIRGPGGYITHKTSPVGDALFIEIQRTLPKGRYFFDVTASEANATLSTIVNSKPRSAKERVIQVDSWLSKGKLDYKGKDNVIVYALATRKGSAVINAKTKVLMESPTGDSIEFDLKDEGIGADAKAQDGVYSGYVPRNLLSASGRYNLKIAVSDNNERAMISYSSGTMLSEDTSDSGTGMIQEPTGMFQRVTMPGELFVENYYAAGDITPPGKVFDLALVSKTEEVSGTGKTLYLLSWTAVGDDLDVGTAARYDIRISETIETMRNSFETGRAFVNTSILQTRPSGEKEQYLLRGLVPGGLDEVTYYLALKAIDDSGNSGPVSNMITVGYVLNFTLEHLSDSVQSNDRTRNHVTIIIVCVCVGLLIIGILLLSLICWKRKKRSKGDMEAEAESVAVELYQKEKIHRHTSTKWDRKNLHSRTKDILIVKK